MTSLSCTACGANSQSDTQIKNCPSCGTPADTHEAPKQSVAGVPAVTDISTAAVAARDAANLEAEAELAARAAATAAAQRAPVEKVPAPDPPTPIPAPGESTAQKVEQGLAIGLADVSAVAKLIADNFGGTPIAAIFKLLGPAAGIGAAVLAQHLQHRGFDLSTLKDADIL